MFLQRIFIVLGLFILVGCGSSLNTEYPLPSKVSNLMEGVPGAINYQTTLSGQEIVTFYRNEFSAQGFNENEVAHSNPDCCCCLLLLLDFFAFFFFFFCLARNNAVEVEEVIR